MTEHRPTQVTLDILCCCAAIFALSGVLLTSPQSIVSLLLFFILFLAALYFVEKQLVFGPAVGVFSFYVLAMLGLYWTQLIAIPDYFGFSGGPGVGTDDNFFYTLAAPSLPEGFPLRENFFAKIHPYGKLLSVFAVPMHSVYGQLHPVDLLLFNAAGLALLPFGIRKLAMQATDDEATARTAFVLSLICPFILANGVVLIRDGLMATIFVLAFYGFLSKRFLLLSLAIIAAGFLRLPQALMLVGSLWLLLVFSTASGAARGMQGKHGLLSTLIILVGPVVLIAVAYTYFGTALLGKLEAVEGLFRESFLQESVFQGAAKDSGTTTFYTINQLSLPLRLPLAFLFYFGAPHLALDTLVLKGALIPRQILTALFAVLFILYAGFFLRGLIRAWDVGNRIVLGLVFVYFVDLLILSQASMQVRHKIALFPLMYVVVAYGVHYKQRDAYIAGACLSLSIGLFAFLFNGYKLWIV